MSSKAKSGGGRKIGRNKDACKAYRASGRREANHGKSLGREGLRITASFAACKGAPGKQVIKQANSWHRRVTALEPMPKREARMHMEMGAKCMTNKKRKAIAERMLESF